MLRNLPIKHDSTDPAINALVIKALKLKPVISEIKASGFDYRICSWADEIGRVYFREVINLEDYYKTTEHKRQQQLEWYKKQKELGIYD